MVGLAGPDAGPVAEPDVGLAGPDVGLAGPDGWVSRAKC